MAVNSTRRDFLKTLTATAAALTLPTAKLYATPNQPNSNPAPSYLADYKELYLQNPHQAALEWFKNAELGLFIHYGIYSIQAQGEWALRNEKIPPAQYEKLKDRFTAENFDPDFITDLALQAGMKYVNITARHHDGFCLFETEQSDYHAANSPAQRDLIAELAQQCQKKKLGLFLYYSYALDWHHPYFYPTKYSLPGRTSLDNPAPGYKFRTDEDFKHYLKFAHNQIKELLTNYGPLAGIWFDPMTPFYGRPDLFPIEQTYAMIREMQPQTLISFKQGANGTEDFAAPERSGKISYEWVKKRFPNNPLSYEVAKNACEKNQNKHNEICDTLQRHKWGYCKSEDNDHLTSAEVITKLNHARDINCNLLINTGPLPDGSIHPADIETLRNLRKTSQNNQPPTQNSQPKNQNDTLICQ